MEIDVKTTVEVSDSDFPTSELIRILEDRGHAVDDNAIDGIKTEFLIKELQERSDWAYEDVPIFDLIEALHRFGCPDNLIEQLEEWAKIPIANKDKLEKWAALAAK